MRSRVVSRQAIAGARSRGLSVTFDFVDANATAAFEASLAHAEDRVRRGLGQEGGASHWRIYRSREASSDGRVLYMVWFEEHGDLETAALSDLLSRRATADDLPQHSLEHSILTLVPVSPAAR